MKKFINGGVARHFCNLPLESSLFLLSLGDMKPARIARLFFIGAGLLFFNGCATSGSQDPSRESSETSFTYRPKPPFLLNALADASDAIAENTDGFIAWRARTNATFFRALTPGFWIERHKQKKAEEEAKAAAREDDQKFLKEPAG